MVRRSFVALGICFGIAVPGHCLDRKEVKQAIVRPCSNREWTIAFSEEARELTREDLKNFGGFSSCEAVALPFLPGATILRLHTPVDVDYSVTASLFRPDEQSPLRHLSRGIGMAAIPNPDEPAAVSAINYLMSKAAVRPDEETLSSVVALELFLIDEEGGAVFGAPIASKERPLTEFAHPAKFMLRDTGPELYVPLEGWHFKFGVSNGHVQVVSVVRGSE